jgi:TrmH family RNA methyltransferase
VGHSTPPELGTHNPEVKRIRALLRDRAARRDEGRFVVEGTRVVDAALADAAGRVERVYVGADASADARAVAARAARVGVECRTLAPGVAARLSDTRHPQGVFAVVAAASARALESFGPADLLVVCELVSDPGNAGTLLRSAAASGVQGVIFGPGSVDAYNPKVVRSSAGACFTVPILEDVPVVAALEFVGAARGGAKRRLGAVPRGGEPPELLDLRAPTAFVLGHETRGLDAALPLDARVTIPLAAGESLNLAMAATVLCFEAARQRRALR